LGTELGPTFGSQRDRVQHVLDRPVQPLLTLALPIQVPQRLQLAQNPPDLVSPSWARPNDVGNIEPERFTIASGLVAGHPRRDRTSLPAQPLVTNKRTRELEPTIVVPLRSELNVTTLICHRVVPLRHAGAVCASIARCRTIAPSVSIRSFTRAPPGCQTMRGSRCVNGSLSLRSVLLAHLTLGVSIFTVLRLFTASDPGDRCPERAHRIVRR